MTHASPILCKASACVFASVWISTFLQKHSAERTAQRSLGKLLKQRKMFTLFIARGRMSGSATYTWSFLRKKRNSFTLHVNAHMHQKFIWTRSSWLNCALRDDEAVYWVSVGYYEAVAVGNWWYWVSRGHSCLYILQKVEIWTGVTDAWQTDWLTHIWKIGLLSSL